MLEYNPLSWIENQSDTPFTIDAKCLIGQLVGDEEQFISSATFHNKVALIRQHQISDGSFESKYGGKVGSVLWTADAVNYLTLLNDPEDHEVVANAAAWLAKRQQSDGSWSENQEIPWKRVWYKSAAGRLWITAATLQSLRTATERQPAISKMTEAGLLHLLNSFETLGKLLQSGTSAEAFLFFGFDTFSLSVCFETLRSYQKDIPLAPEIIQFFQRQQLANGSWDDSVDVTQCTTHGLLLLGESPYSQSIDKAINYLARKQNSDGSWSHSFSEPGDWTLTAYTTRLFLMLAKQSSFSLFNNSHSLVKQC